MLKILLALSLHILEGRNRIPKILKNLEANLALDRPPGNKHSCQSKRRPDQKQGKQEFGA